MRLLLRALAVASLAALFAVPAAAQAQLEVFPLDGQLYPRRENNLANVRVQGTVTEAGWDRAWLQLYADGVPTLTDRQDLNYAGGGAPFTLQVPIEAGLVDYAVELELRNSNGTQIIARADYLACGDVFLVQGQSNAAAGDGWNEGLANRHFRSRWVRSYGTGSVNGGQTERIDQWFRADGNRSNARGAVGQWALPLGAMIVEHIGVPVAILNGAVGATPITWHQRNDVNPYDTGTIYGRLLWRAEAAGLREHVRAIFWYQGEADGGAAQHYGHRFDNLIADWRKDYPALDRVYVMQVRQGCGAGPDSDIFEVQRQIPLRHPEVRMMSTTSLPRHDGCHFYFAGYYRLAEQLARMVAQDYYGWAFTDAQVEPPDPIVAQYANAFGNRLVVQFGPQGTMLTAEAGAEADFQLDDGVQVTGVSTQGNLLFLDLDGPTQSATLRYVGHERNGGRIMNELGVGALTFELPIQ